MGKKDLVGIISYIVDRGLQTIKDNTQNQEAALDYVAIFSKDEDEYQALIALAAPLGKETDAARSKTGRTFLLDEAISTPAGPLKIVKIRKPDPTRPQRGGPDFKVPNYEQFKEKYLKDGRNLTLMVRSDYEMIEIKGADVLVYIPSQTVSERLKS